MCVYIYIYIYTHTHTHTYGLPQWLSGKESACNAGDSGEAVSIPGLGRFPGGGHGNPLQYSCLENPMDRGAWCATVHRVVKSWTLLKWLSTHTQTHTHTHTHTFTHTYRRVLFDFDRDWITYVDYILERIDVLPILSPLIHEHILSLSLSSYIWLLPPLFYSFQHKYTFC